MYACLSPNGQMRYNAATPPTTLFVATAKGVAILERAATDAAWKLRGTALDGHHASTMAVLPDQSGLFVGTHGHGIYFSADLGRNWEKRDTGVTFADIYTIAAIDRGRRTIVYAGTEPAALFRSFDHGKNWED